MIRPMRFISRLRRENGGRSRPVVIGRDLDKVHADDVAKPAEAVDELQNLVVQKAAVGWRSGAGRD